MAAAQITGAVGEPLSLLPGPILRADPRCGAHEMTEGLLDQRNCRIIAAAVEQAFQSEQPNFRREFRLLDSKSPRGAYESGRFGSEVPRTDQRDIDKPGVFRCREPLAALATHLDQV